MIRIAVAGATGYTGIELVRLLMGHPQVELTCVTSQQYSGQLLADVFPQVGQRVDLVCDPLDVDVIARKADFVFTALPHQAAMDIVADLVGAGKRVVDLSADFRLRDADLYAQWYQAHSQKDLLPKAVYGLPEIYREKIVPAMLVANPGCYPTSAILALSPLLSHPAVALDSIVVDSKSGTSGAGRGAKTGSLFCEVNEGFKAYSVASHRHTPEIEQSLAAMAGQTVKITFTPHLLPISRGILSTCYATLTSEWTAAELVALFREYYRGEPFVRVYDAGSLPNVGYVRGSNFCDIGVAVDQRTGRVIVVSAIDNLVKGAAGQAVQNMNLMLGFPEEAALTALPLFP